MRKKKFLNITFPTIYDKENENHFTQIPTFHTAKITNALEYFFTQIHQINNSIPNNHERTSPYNQKTYTHKKRKMHIQWVLAVVRTHDGRRSMSTRPAFTLPFVTIRRTR